MQEVLKKLTMFIETWEVGHIDVSKLVVLDQRHKEPEGDLF